MLEAATGQAVAILDSCPIAMVVVKDRRIVWANRAMHELLGYPPDALIGRPTRTMFLDQESYEAFGRSAHSAVEKGNVYRDQIQQKRQDGSTGWFEFHISRLEGHPDMAVGAVLDVTEKHDLAEGLKQSNERHRSVLQDQTEVISRFRPDGTFVFVNEGYCTLFGKAQEALIGQRWHPIAHPDDLPIINDKLREMTADNPVVTIENRVLVAGGGQRWMQFVNRGFFDADGLLEEVQSVGRDITRRKQAETALTKSEALLHRAQAVAHIGSFALMGDSDHFTCTDETARLFGLDGRLEVRFADWFSRVHPDDQVDVEAAWGAALQGAPYDMTYRIVVRGQVIWIRALADLTFDEQGHLLECVGTVQDITDARRIESAVYESEERLEMALAGSGLALWDWDLTTGNILFSDRWYEMLGLTPEATPMHVDRWKGLFNPNDLVRVEGLVAAYLAGETSVLHSEHRIRHDEGHWITVEATGKVSRRDAAGKPLRIVGTALDISGKKRLHQEGIELLKQIETLIRESTARSPTQSAGSAALESLTKRERQILGMIAEGMTSVEISRQLKLAANTVISHRQKLMAKLGLHRTAEVIRFALDHDLAKPS